MAVSPRVSATGYYGYAAGGPASAVNYPAGNNTAFGYIELLVQF
jgi:hypothetical protein